MLEADNMLSPSFSSPVALNLVPIDSDDAGPTNVTWDNVESNLRLEDSAAAQSLYTEALDLIDEATSPRLRSAIILRQGCIAHIQACTSSLSSSLKSRFLEEADNKLAEASRLFQGDQTNTQIVRGHQILLRITRGDVSRVQQDAADIGRWGLETKNEGISQFVGLLMIRFGRRQWIDRSRFDVASHCYRCARACFLRLKDQIATFQALASELELHQSISDFIAARSLLDDQLPLFREVIAQIDAFAEQAQDPRTYFILRKNMLTTYGSLVSNVLRNSDVRMLSEWRVELDNYNNCPAMIEAMNEAVEDPYIQQNLLTDPTLQGDYGSVFEGEQPDQALYDQYHAVNAKYQENLENSDIHSAEGILHSFIQIAATANASSYVRYLIRIYAHFQLGETDKARALFDAIADSEVFDDRVKDDATSNVSWTHSKYMKRLQNPESADNAIALCTVAHDWKRGHKLLTRIQELSPGFLDPVSGDRVPDLWHRFCWAGLIAEHNEQYAFAFSLLLKAAELAELRRSQTSDVDARRSSFSVLGVGEIFAGLTRLCLRSDEAGVPLAVIGSYQHKHPVSRSWKEHALLFQEQGKARSLLDALLSRHSDPKGISPKLVRASKQRLRTALKGLPAGTRTPEETQEMERLDKELRVVNEEADPLMPLLPESNPSIPMTDLCAAIGRSALVVEITFSRYGSTLFGLDCDGIQFARASPTRDVDIRKPALTVLHSIRRYAEQPQSSWRNELDEPLRKITEEVLTPVADLVSSKDHIIFVTSQPMTAFPLAALTFRDEPLCIHKAISQVPSLTNLAHLYARVGKEAVTPSLSAIAKSHDESDIKRYLKEPGKAEPPLPMAGIEAMVISRMFGTWPTMAKNVGRQKFRDLVGNSSIVLLGTHGLVDSRSPWFSNVSLKQKFRVLDLFKPAPMQPLLCLPHASAALVELQ
ncbi:hypothetical protein H2199_003745 [Coniosporium tulheliwenetii]|uniref:Uncharacterized protein n=1 Tax=Coniosporium tulheliwenetii TaxID=3383036 RepID=A0ACC2ZB82_9PEZI|nr:hypothetical protein H2199_003745 [Cladosporium sp. JES 115]